VVGIIMGLDVHKRSIYVTELKDDGNKSEQYEMANSEDCWNEFRDRYLNQKPEIALEVSTSGKYVTRLLRDMGFSVHMADPSKLPVIYKSAKKNDREDSYKLARALHLGELSEVYLPSAEIDDLRSMARYRKSIGEEITMLKNRIHAILTGHGISVPATDIFGNRGLRIIESRSAILSSMEKVTLADMLERIKDLEDRASSIEDEMARCTIGNRDVNLLMTIPGINLYSATAIAAEIGDIKRFEKKEKLASYAGLTPRQNQSGNRDIKGHITKHGPSMIRFILVTAAHSLIKYSKKMKMKYLSIVRRLGKNRAIVAIARILVESIYTMLSRGVEFNDQIETLTVRKQKAMAERSKNPAMHKGLEESIKLFIQKRDRKMTG
jgi:transposase